MAESQERGVRYPATVRLVAMAYEMDADEVVPMLVKWKEEEGLTYQAMKERLAEHQPPVDLSIQRLSEFVNSYQRAREELARQSGGRR